MVTSTVVNVKNYFVFYNNVWAVTLILISFIFNDIPYDSYSDYEKASLPSLCIIPLDIQLPGIC